jgi:hypothetical protein
MLPVQRANFSIVELHLSTETLSDTQSQLSLDIAFPVIPIRRGYLEPTDYYVGTTGATVTLTAKEAEFVDYTGPVGIDVEYEQSAGKSRSQTGKLAPEYKTKLGPAELQLKPGSLESSFATTSGSSIKYQSKEFLLAPTKSVGSLTWQVDMPRGEKAVRDFLLGNLSLSATLEWQTTDRHGTAQARPSCVAFFDGGKRKLEGWRACVLMLFILWRRGIRLNNQNGVYRSF